MHLNIVHYKGAYIFIDTHSAKLTQSRDLAFHSTSTIALTRAPFLSPLCVSMYIQFDQLIYINTYVLTRIFTMKLPSQLMLRLIMTCTYSY